MRLPSKNGAFLTMVQRVSSFALMEQSTPHVLIEIVRHAGPIELVKSLLSGKEISEALGAVSLGRGPSSMKCLKSLDKETTNSHRCKAVLNLRWSKQDRFDESLTKTLPNERWFLRPAMIRLLLLSLVVSHRNCVGRAAFPAE